MQLLPSGFFYHDPGSPCGSGGHDHETHRRRSRMVGSSLSGSGEGPGWETAPGYSTLNHVDPASCHCCPAGDSHRNKSPRRFIVTNRRRTILLQPRSDGQENCERAFSGIGVAEGRRRRRLPVPLGVRILQGVTLHRVAAPRCPHVRPVDRKVHRCGRACVSARHSTAV